MPEVTKYIVQPYIPVDMDECEEYDTPKEAEAVIDHLEMLQPENIYRIEEIRSVE